MERCTHGRAYGDSAHYKQEKLWNAIIVWKFSHFETKLIVAVTAQAQPTAVFEWSDALIAASIIFAAIGWIITYILSGRLQQKQLTVSLIQSFIFEPSSVEASRDVFHTVRTHKSHPWKDAAERCLEGSPQQGEEELFAHVRHVLNWFEFLSIAILTGAANEEFLKLTYRGQFTSLYARTKDMIEYMRSYADNPSIYANFEKVAKKWSSPLTATKQI
ncbi:MAG: DUF4760 domain-containing protein [SAR324 cluster bacterium]|nr:DUF4760 domain-containing protein [SAR324 cluster bacterium]